MQTLDSKETQLPATKDKRLQKNLQRVADLSKQADKSLKATDFLLRESKGYLEAEEGEQTLKFRQKDLKQLVPIVSAQNIFDLDLEFGSYQIDFTRTGDYLLLGGSQGQISLLKWRQKQLVCEFNVKQKIRDVKFLQDENLYAVAQKNYTYIYDKQGIEIHRLKSHPEPQHLEYLPYHYLLVSISAAGKLVYHDISTGQIVVEHKTKLRNVPTMVQNPYNGIIAVGDNKGTVTMWSPNTGTPLVKIFCHNSQVNLVQFTHDGNYFVTSGNDSFVKVYDARKYEEVYTYWTPQIACSASISQTGLLALGYNDQTQIWKDWYQEKQKRPYMKQETPNQKYISDLQFVSFDDYLGVGQDGGFSSFLVPGAGEANFDQFEISIFASQKQKKEAKVQKLLDKLPADSIVLNPNIIGGADRVSRAIIEKEKKQEEEEIENKKQQNKKKKKKARGKSKSSKEENKKQSGHDQKIREKLRDKLLLKMKVQRAEKEKLKTELDVLNATNILNNLNPVELIKKKLKTEDIKQ